MQFVGKINGVENAQPGAQPDRAIAMPVSSLLALSVYMRETIKHIANGNAFDELLPLLVGKVFHVTKVQNWYNIMESGKLLPKPPEMKHVRTFGTKSYFQKEGCICLFDYRRFYEDKPQMYYDRCLPTQPLTENNPICVLFLNQVHYENLVSWSQWHVNGIGTNVVPYIEAGLKGEIALSFFDEALIVTIIAENKNSLAYQLKEELTEKI